MSDNPLLKFVKERLDGMPPEKRQKVIKYGIIGGAAALVIGIYYMTGQDHKKPPPPKEAASVVELGDARMEDDIRAQVAREHQEIEGGNRKRDERTKEQQERIEQQEAQIKAMQGVLTAISQGGATGLPDGKLPGGAPSDPMDWQGGPAGGQGGIRGTGAGGAAPAPNQPPPQLEFVGGVGHEGNTKPASPAGDPSKKKNHKFYLPPSFMPAKLLTGLAAKTVDGAKSDPEPIMLRVQAPAVLPNEVRAQLQGCLVVAHGFGSLASERVETRLVSISCLDLEGKSMIDAEIHGIVVDNDGVKGLVGHPVSKMGTNLARLAFAGAMEGAAAAFSQTATTTSVSALGATQTIDPSQIGKAGAGRGAEKAADEYGRIIADLVRQQAPVLEVGPSKDVTVVVTEGSWLELKGYEELAHE